MKAVNFLSDPRIRRDTFEVGMGEVALINDGAQTTDITTCIGFVAVAESKDLAVLAHLSDIGPNVGVPNNSVKNFQLALEVSRAIGADDFWLIGGRPYLQAGQGGSTYDATAEDRLFAERAIAGIPGPITTHLVWNPGQSSFFDVIVNLQDPQNPVTVIEHPVIN